MTPELLTDKVVAVTGASRGIGAATATLLTEQGRRVVISDIAPEPLTGTQVILWVAPFDVASESAVVSGIVDIPNSCCSLYLPTQIFDFDIRPNGDGPVSEARGSAAKTS